MTTRRNRPGRCSRTDSDLAEAFAYLGLTVFTAYFLNYAGTELDVPASPELRNAAAGQGHN